MMDLTDALHQLKITSKARRLQRLWPTIEAKLAEGISHAEIRRLLNETGLEITERTYKSYLYRYRKRRRSRGPERAPMRLTEPTQSHAADVAQAAIPAAPAGAEKHQRPPTFDYDPRGISPELLK
jgi:hypothetical protein